jgi:hypothetical protein
MDSRLTDSLIEDALTSQPLAPMPRSITADVMARLQKEHRPTLFTWNDALLSLVIVLSAAALWFTFQNLPPMLVAKIRIQGILLYQDILVNARWLVPSAMFGIAALLAGMTIPALVRMSRSRL